MARMGQWAQPVSTLCYHQLLLWIMVFHETAREWATCHYCTGGYDISWRRTWGKLELHGGPPGGDPSSEQTVLLYEKTWIVWGCAGPPWDECLSVRPDLRDGGIPDRSVDNLYDNHLHWHMLPANPTPPHPFWVERGCLLNAHVGA